MAENSQAVKKDPALGNAFMDIALLGMLLTTVGVLLDVFAGEGINVYLIGACVITYGAFLVGGLRLGISPVVYLRNLTRRPS